MTERIRSRRAPPRGRKTIPKPGEKPRGGAGLGQGRKAGGMNATTALKLKKARDQGKTSAELLNDWALTGRMLCGNRYEDLTTDQRITAARAAAPYYSSHLQPRPAEGQTPPTYRIELDPTVIAKLSSDKLEIMREVFRAIASGVTGVEGLVPVAGAADPNRYARSLRPDSPTEGRA